MQIIYRLTPGAHRDVVLDGDTRPIVRSVSGAVTPEAVAAVQDRLRVLPSGIVYVTGRAILGGSARPEIQGGGDSATYDGQECARLGAVTHAAEDAAGLLAVLAAEAEACREAQTAYDRARAEAQAADDRAASDKIEQVVEAALAAPDAEWYDTETGDWRYTYPAAGPMPCIVRWSPASIGTAASRDARIVERRAAVDARRQAIIAALVAEQVERADCRLELYLRDPGAEWTAYQAAWCTRYADRLPHLSPALAERERRATAHEVAVRAHITARLGDLVPDILPLWGAGEVCRDSAIGAIADAVYGPDLPVADTRTCRDRQCPCGWEDRSCLPVSVARRLTALLARLPAGATATGYQYGQSHDDIDQDVQSRWVCRVTVPDGPLTLARTIAV